MRVRAFACFHGFTLVKWIGKNIKESSIVIQILFMNNMRYFMVIVAVVAAVVGVDTPIDWEYLQIEGAKTTANLVS